MADYDGISQYRKAAARRLRDAEELLQPPTVDAYEHGSETRHLRAAVYLAGYAIECILKVYLISQVAVANTLSDVIEARRATGEQFPNILGTDGHRLDILVSLTDLEAQFGNEKRKRDWSLCVKWKSTWRYDPNPPTEIFAFEFVAAVRRIYRWVEGQV